MSADSYQINRFQPGARVCTWVCHLVRHSPPQLPSTLPVSVILSIHSPVKIGQLSWTMQMVRCCVLVLTEYSEDTRAIPNTHELYRKYTGNTEHTRTIPRIHGQYRTHDYTENTRAIPNTHELYRTRVQMLSVIVYRGLRNRQVFPFPTALLNPTLHYYLPTSTKGRFFLR